MHPQRASGKIAHVGLHAEWHTRRQDDLTAETNRNRIPPADGKSQSRRHRQRDPASVAIGCADPTSAARHLFHARNTALARRGARPNGRDYDSARCTSGSGARAPPRRRSRRSAPRAWRDAASAIARHTARASGVARNGVSKRALSNLSPMERPAAPTTRSSGAHLPGRAALPEFVRFRCRVAIVLIVM